MSVFSRPVTGCGAPVECHAEGVLAVAGVLVAQDLDVWGEWPPADAAAVDVTACTRVGRGRVWVRAGVSGAGRRCGSGGEELVRGGGPAADAAADAAVVRAASGAAGRGLHALVRAWPLPASRGWAVVVPFAWRGVSVHAAGAGVLRARLDRRGRTRCRSPRWTGPGCRWCRWRRWRCGPCPREGWRRAMTGWMACSPWAGRRCLSRADPVVAPVSGVVIAGTSRRWPGGLRI